MSYGWNTTKTAAGFVWTVTSFEYGVGTIVLHSGICRTRAQAVLQAKKYVIGYRVNA